MSIIPYNYAANREVVLRHNNAVVVWDPQSKQLALRDASHADLDLTECPYCHRPLQRDDDPQRGHDRAGSTAGVAAGFVNPDYFRLLHDSLPGSDVDDASAPPSPRRRLVQPTGLRSSPAVASAPAGESRDSTPGISATAFSQGYFARFFVEEKELGRGGKGVVLLVKHVLDGVALGYFACKRVPVGDDHEWLEKVLIEVQLLQYLSHQHLVSYRHVWLEDIKLSNFGPSVPCAFILQQYCNAGNLHTYIVDQPEEPSDGTYRAQLKARLRRRSQHQPDSPEGIRSRKLHFEDIYSFFKDITSGLNHLHVNGYIHRDLKPSNCLLHDSGKGVLRVLVSDFGEVQLENVVRKSTGATGTISYCAPEVLRRNDFGSLGNFTTKSDIFSLGMILYFLCFSRLPYMHADNLNEENEDLDQLKEEITSWSGLHEERKLRPDLPEKLYTFLRRLLSLTPADRPSAEEILHGIKTGSGLDEIADARPPSAGHIFDDLRNTSRISPIDSPHGGTPRPQTPTQRQSATGFTRPGGAANLRLSSFQKFKARAQSPSEDDGSTSPNDSLILREQYPSPTTARRSMGQLPAPPHSSPWFGVRIPDLNNSSTRSSLKVIIFFLKLFSLNRLCDPMAARPIVTYPLLALAASDLTFTNLRLGVSQQPRWEKIPDRPIQKDEGKGADRKRKVTIRDVAHHTTIES
ncbi:MAG: hypothetical protein LQ344_002999 [Seirophora lacunosa]|nr:MAG: hypothetical protein LQ344_002999 [Seirophora lacunosa]